MFRIPHGSRTRARARAWVPCLRLLCCAAAALALAGCTSGGTAALKSVADRGELTAHMRVLVYGSTDRNTADVFMSDLPREALEPDGDLSEVSGQLVHIHVFITPEAGNTPIDTNACSVVVRWIVVARGDLGLYGGGAFLNPSDSPGDSLFSGAIRAGTCRLLTSTPGFVDRLGPSDFSTKFGARRDEAGTARLRERLATMLELLPAPAPLKARP